jgi:hypothetical protein
MDSTRQDENRRRHPVQGAVAKIITLDKKDYFSEKKGGEFLKVGREWGEDNKTTKQGATEFIT